MRRISFFLLFAAGCASGGGSPDGSAAGMDGATSNVDAGSNGPDAGPPPPRDGGRFHLPDAGPPMDSSFVTSCTGAANGTPCEADRNGCTDGDHCQGEICIPGTPVTCDDSMNCTTDTCVATSFTAYTCMNETSAMTCTLDGTCYSNGMVNPASACQRCNSSMSMSSWTVNAGMACNDGDSCSMADVCMADGTCAGTGSRDTYDPNDLRGAAHGLGSISDTDDFPFGTLMPTLYPTADGEDWFSYHDSDDTGGEIWPRVDLSGIPAGRDYDLCAYFDCDGPLISVGCESGTASTFEGLPGCCSAASGSANESVRLNPDCDFGTFGADDSGTIYVRVFRFEGAPTCDPYTLTWGDD